MTFSLKTRFTCLLNNALPPVLLLAYDDIDNSSETKSMVFCKFDQLKKCDNLMHCFRLIHGTRSKLVLLLYFRKVGLQIKIRVQVRYTDVHKSSTTRKEGLKCLI